MKRFILASLMLAMVAPAAAAQEMPEMPKPTKEHEWLQQLVGDWENECEIFMVPGQPPMTSKGTEHARSLGGFWVIGEGESDMMGTPVKTLLTLGYDADKKKYVGTWADSMSGYLWHYTGTVDPTGKILTLDTEGPCPLKPGQLSKFQEVLEIKDKDNKVFTSSMLGDDGKWQKMVTVTSRRVR